MKSFNLKILLVEDEPLTQRVHGVLLNSLGCSFDLAKTGKEAIRFFNRKKYDLVLLDKELPDMDGLDVCKCVRKSFSKRRLPVFANTARGNSVKKECLQAGCNGFFVKPLTEKRLGNAIARCFGSSCCKPYQNVSEENEQQTEMRGMKLC